MKELATTAQGPLVDEYLGNQHQESFILFYVVVYQDIVQYFSSSVGLETWMEHRGVKEYSYSVHRMTPEDAILLLADNRSASLTLSHTFVVKITVRKS